ncbi:MAG: hypothetical protein QOK09_3220, partial [Mycobacterium sp.]|nr:hypothetical protein [Mycobacterium sp.]
MMDFWLSLEVVDGAAWPRTHRVIVSRSYL